MQYFIEKKSHGLLLNSTNAAFPTASSSSGSVEGVYGSSTEGVYTRLCDDEYISIEEMASSLQDGTSFISKELESSRSYAHTHLKDAETSVYNKSTLTNSDWSENVEEPQSDIPEISLHTIDGHMKLKDLETLSHWAALQSSDDSLLTEDNETSSELHVSTLGQLPSSTQHSNLPPTLTISLSRLKTNPCNGSTFQVEADMPTAYTDMPTIDPNTPQLGTDMPIIDPNTPQLGTNMPPENSTMRIPLVETNTPLLDTDMPTPMIEIDRPLENADMPIVNTDIPIVYSDMSIVETDMPTVETDLSIDGHGITSIDLHLASVELSFTAESLLVSSKDISVFEMPTETYGAHQTEKRCIVPKVSVRSSQIREEIAKIIANQMSLTNPSANHRRSLSEEATTTDALPDFAANKVVYSQRTVL